jgi:hypothetical protein
MPNTVNPRTVLADEERASELRERIAAVLSDIFSDRYECKVTLHFEAQKTK